MVDLAPIDYDFYPDDDQCCICGMDTMDDDPIIFCDGCEIAVHKWCYGVKVIPEGDWFCHKCSYIEKHPNMTEPQCAVCPEKRGALTPCEDQGQFVHTICAVWLPELKFKDGKSVGKDDHYGKVIGLNNITKDSYCNVQSGPCIQCGVSKKCTNAYHATCSYRALIEGKNEECNWVSHCPRHLPQDELENQEELFKKQGSKRKFHLYESCGKIEIVKKPKEKSSAKRSAPSKSVPSLSRKKIRPAAPTLSLSNGREKAYSVNSHLNKDHPAMPRPGTTFTVDCVGGNNKLIKQFENGVNVSHRTELNDHLMEVFKEAFKDDRLMLGLVTLPMKSQKLEALSHRFEEKKRVGVANKDNIRMYFIPVKIAKMNYGWLKEFLYDENSNTYKEIQQHLLKWWTPFACHKLMLAEEVESDQLLRTDEMWFWTVVRMGVEDE